MKLFLLKYNKSFSTFKTNFYPVCEKPVFPKEEERVYNYWEEKDCF
jgi:hypothetical protein